MIDSKKSVKQSAANVCINERILINILIVCIIMSTVP